MKQVPIDHLEIGDVIRVVPGGSPPADGIVMHCSASSFDESALTGESIPVNKVNGDRVFAGSICKNGEVDIQIEQLDGGTM